MRRKLSSLFEAKLERPQQALDGVAIPEIQAEVAHNSTALPQEKQMQGKHQQFAPRVQPRIQDP